MLISQVLCLPGPLQQARLIRASINFESSQLVLRLSPFIPFDKGVNKNVIENGNLKKITIWIDFTRNFTWYKLDLHMYKTFIVFTEGVKSTYTVNVT